MVNFIRLYSYKDEFVFKMILVSSNFNNIIIKIFCKIYSVNKLNKNTLQKKLLYRSKNRGCKEMDYILGSFASTYLPLMEEKKLSNYALILDKDDNDLYNWITNKSYAPSNLDAEIMDQLRNIAKI